MLHLSRLLTAALLLLTTGVGYGQTHNTASFHKVIVSPYIEATFIQGDQERVVINNSGVEPGKIHIETRKGVLRVYLEGAKEIPRKPNGRDLYSAHSVTATIYYKHLDALSLRGEERFTCLSPVSTADFAIKLYGESTITFKEVHIDNLRATVYGESSLELQAGSVERQYYTAYGEATIDAVSISGGEAKITAYGESDFNMNVSERIRITSFGEAKIRNKGNAHIIKGINFGEVRIAKVN